MSEPRTVTVHTTDHGPITLVCPPWCIGQHEDGGYRADIIHIGPEITLAFHGIQLMDAGIVQSPHATLPTPGLGGPTPGVSVHPLGRTLDPVGLYSLAAALDGYSDELRGLAGQLDAILAGGGQ
ncbi:DUF6907 domain-containing protein [Streptomyces phaeochromogenes]